MSLRYPARARSRRRPGAAPARSCTARRCIEPRRSPSGTARSRRIDSPVGLGDAGRVAPQVGRATPTRIESSSCGVRAASHGRLRARLVACGKGIQRCDNHPAVASRRSLPGTSSPSRFWETHRFLGQLTRLGMGRLGLDSSSFVRLSRLAAIPQRRQAGRPLAAADRVEQALRTHLLVV